MEKRAAQVRKVVLIESGKWGIIVDFVLEEKELVGKDLRVDYPEMNELNESAEGYLMIETVQPPVIRSGETIDITIRERSRRRRRGARIQEPEPRSQEIGGQLGQKEDFRGAS
jgi:hypothetical protein